MLIRENTPPALQLTLNLPFFTVAHVERDREKDDTDNRKWKLNVHSVYDGPLRSYRFGIHETS